MQLQFQAWATPFSSADVDILAVSYGPGRVHALVGRGESVHLVSYTDVIAHRVLDEHGLMELWRAASESPPPATTTFKVRGHSWMRERPNSFHLGGDWSFMIAIKGDCLEVVCKTAPTVRAVPHSASPKEREHICSFCLKPFGKTGVLGFMGAICNDCVWLCVDSLMAKHVPRPNLIHDGPSGWPRPGLAWSLAVALREEGPR